MKINLAIFLFMLSAPALYLVDATAKINEIDKPKMVRRMNLKGKRRLDVSTDENRKLKSAKEKKGKKSPPPEDQNISQQSTDGTTVTVTCPETTSGNKTNTTITYQYSLETTTSELGDIEEKLKSDMFESLSSNTCPSSRRISVTIEIIKKADIKLTKQRKDIHSHFHRRRLELVEMESSAKDTKSASCTPKENTNNTCTEYNGNLFAVINDVGDNSNEENIIKSILTHLNYYAENTNFTSIDKGIVNMKILTKGTSSTQEVRNAEGSNPATIAGSTVAAIVLLAGLVFAYTCMKKKTK